MRVTYHIYKVTTTVNLTNVQYLVAETPKGAKEKAWSIFESGTSDLVSNILSEDAITFKCERIQLQELDDVLECLEAARKLGSGLNMV